MLWSAAANIGSESPAVNSCSREWLLLIRDEGVAHPGFLPFVILLFDLRAGSSDDPAPNPYTLIACTSALAQDHQRMRSQVLVATKGAGHIS